MMILVGAVITLALSTVQATTPVTYTVPPEIGPCEGNETTCNSGCCPYPNGVCCSETRTCCREGSVCVELVGYCIGLEEDDFKPSVFSEKAAALRETGCPSGTTECTGGCCPLPNAVCCQGGLTCCPHGTTCGAPGSGLCYKELNLVSRFLKAVLSRSMDPYYIVNDVLPRGRPFAPEGVTGCPSGMTQCTGGCCPMPNAVCCQDGLTCCPSGSVCGPEGSGLCFKGVSRTIDQYYDVNNVLTRRRLSEATSVTGCPSGMTQCTGGCCPMPNAVCCQDGLTCCPSGSVCGPEGSGLCYKGVSSMPRFLNTPISRDQYYDVNGVFPRRRLSVPPPVTGCPSGMTQCTGGCCPMPNAVCCQDGLTCCPSGSVCGPEGSGLCYKGVSSMPRFWNTAISRDQYYDVNGVFPRRRLSAPTSGLSCCDTVFGFLCCPDPSICTYGGCV